MLQTLHPLQNTLYMNENTKNKFAELLKAANQKAATQCEKKPIVTAPVIDKPIVTDSPELSTMTFADLLSEEKPKDEVIAVPVVDKPNLRIVDYSDKAFAIVGDTKPIKDTLRLLGGSFNSRLTCGMGWIFSKKRLDAVKKELNLA